MIRTLSENAQQMINGYVHLSIGKKSIRCPYVNNKHLNLRAALRVLVGKGSPEEIEEEAMIIAMRDKIDLEAIDAAEITQFLVDHHLGIDCSAFVFYVLNAELHGKVKKHIHPLSNNPLRRLLAKLRTVENVNVKTLAHEKNSTAVPLSTIQPGDMIIMIGTGNDHALDHVMLITEVHGEQGHPVLLRYMHALQWKKDGKYNHGIRSGTIAITDTNNPLLEQQWTEETLTNTPENETWWRASTATRLELRRLHWSNKA